MSDLRLVIWDVDGTLVNSRAAITYAMKRAFDVAGLRYPGDEATLAGVGLSIEELFANLLPDLGVKTHQHLATAYKKAYYDRRAELGARDLAPFFDGVSEVLDLLRAQDWTLMAVATGKSRRGLDAMITGHELDGYFQSTQTADDHPSKPNPAMVLAALAETGVTPDRAVMIGDTSFDLDMARAAGVQSIGVSWGYHPAADLSADKLVTACDQIPAAIDALIGTTA